MPLPKPKKGEQQDDWMNRCMGHPKMNSEYPDRSQRYAICLSQWDRRKKKQLESGVLVVDDNESEDKEE